MQDVFANIISKKALFQNYFNERFKDQKQLAQTRFDQTSDLVKSKLRIFDCPECLRRI